MSTPIVRNLVVQCWGTPQVTVGSVNEPREMEEHGVRFNEKWVYRLGKRAGEPRERILYWLRYDFLASFLVESDGSVVREDPSSIVAGLRDRRFDPSAVTH